MNKRHLFWIIPLCLMVGWLAHEIVVYNVITSEKMINTLTDMCTNACDYNYWNCTNRV